MSYISVPIIYELISRLETDDSNYDNVKATLSSLLTHGFPLTLGFAVRLKHNPDSIPCFVVSRLGSKSPETGTSLVDHVVIQAKHPTDSLEQALGKLANTTQNSRIQNGRCWAVLAAGMQFRFYEYDEQLPGNAKLIGWIPPCRCTNSLDICDDETVMEWMFNYMRQNNSLLAPSHSLCA